MHEFRCRTEPRDGAGGERSLAAVGHQREIPRGGSFSARSAACQQHQNGRLHIVVFASLAFVSLLSSAC